MIIQDLELSSGQICQFSRTVIKIMSKEITAVILAGGRGERMGTLTQLQQKCMFLIDGRPILSYILDNIQTAFGSAHSIIATGHQGESVKEYFKNQYGNISINYVHNPERLETKKRLLLADDLIKGPFLYLAGDVISQPTQFIKVAETYEKDVSENLLGAISAATDHLPALSHALITAENGRAVEMVYPATPIWNDEQLREMGIAYYDREFLQRLRQAKPEQTYLSHVITEAIKGGLEFAVVKYFEKWYHFLRPEDLDTTIDFSVRKR